MSHGILWKVTRINLGPQVYTSVMKCKISCSFGEIVDKVTILRIKEAKAQDMEAKLNIKNEMQAICSENEEVNRDDTLFQDLYKVNSKLWVLEDLIREKSRKKEFDEQYITYAERIHTTNDERYDIKRKINDKYNSYFKEEKIYKKHVSIEAQHERELEYGKKCYTEGDYKKSLTSLSKLWDHFKDIPEKDYDNFFVDLLFSCVNIYSIYKTEETLDIYIENVMRKLPTLNIPTNLKLHVHLMYATYALKCEKYQKAYPYINQYNTVKGPGVSHENMCFFKAEDRNKTLLIYEGGGLGDKFMFARFIPLLCTKYATNRIVFFTNDHVVWFFEKMRNDHENLQLLKYSEHAKIPPFDYHCSLIYVMKELNVTYENLEFVPLFRHIGTRQIDNKTKYIINWKGSEQSGHHEKHNRRMELKYAESLFQIPNIHWVVITQNVSNEERKILKKNNVEYLENIDKGPKCFEDSVDIIKSCEGVLSTDTSIAHLSLNVGIKTYVLLTKGHEWRWGRGQNTKWYPNAILMKQETQGDWTNVIDKLSDVLREKHCKE